MSFGPRHREAPEPGSAPGAPRFTLEIAYIPQREDFGQGPWDGVVYCNGVQIGRGSQMASRQDLIEAAESLVLTFRATEPRIPYLEEVEL